MTTNLESLDLDELTAVPAAPAPEPTQYTIPEGITPVWYRPVQGEFEDQYTAWIESVPAGDRVNWPGTFRFVNCSRDQEDWVSSNRRVRAAVVDGKPRTGEHYLVFGKYIVRYDNEYSLRSRNHSSSPWSVVAGANGEPWLLPNDHVPALDPDDHYIAVTFDMSNLGQSDESKPAWEDSYGDVTLGLHQTEEDGSVILNPELHVGQLYLCWNQEAVANGDEYVRLGMYVGGGVVEEAFAYTGHYYRYRDGYDPEFSAQYSYTTVADNWVKFALQSAETPTRTRTDTWEAYLAEANKRFEKFNEETNKLALERGWCSSYEGITSRLGMKSRWHGWWQVDVTIKACVTREEVNGYTARDFLGGLGVNGRVIRNLSMEAEMTVKVPGIRAETAELAKEAVDEAAVKKALKKLGMESTEVTEFTVLEPYEDRDSAYNSIRNTNDDEDSEDDD